MSAPCFLSRRLPLFALLGALGCGARTPLEWPDLDQEASVDARADAPVVARDAGPEADVPLLPLECRPLRVHTRLGFVTTLRPGTPNVVPTGWQWQLLSSPVGSRPPQLFQDGSLDVRVTPDALGTFELLATHAQPDGSTLRCPVTLVTDPPDPACPGYALVEPVVTPLPQGTLQMAWSETWGNARGAPQALSNDDLAARVAVALWEQPDSSGSSPQEALGVAAQVTEAALGAMPDTVPSFLGRASTLSNGWLVRRSLYRTERSTDEGSLRDEVAAMLGHPVPAGPAHSGAGAFYLDLATVYVTASRRVATLLTVTPVGAYDDSSLPTSLRAEDVANATALAPVGSALDARCQAVRATRDPSADLLWAVDTSPSIYDDQERIGSTAARFFEELTSTGLDFRMGVLEAGSGSFNPLGFRWIGGSSAGGALQMAWQVTVRQFQGNSADTQQPYHLDSANPREEEEPMAASVLATQGFEARAAAGDANPDHSWRAGATHIVFWVTDETAMQNDWGRFFSRDPRWGTGRMPDTAQRIAAFFQARNIVPFGMVPVRTGSDPCASLETLDACVITIAGGSYLPINSSDGAAQERALQGMLSRVADAAAGGSSEFVLPSTPISSSLRVRVDGAVVPRSRAEGFDYQDSARTLVFRGAQYRPRLGATVRAAYFLWQ